MKIIPFGYANPGSEALLHSLMQDPKMLLIDTRYTPYCGWNNGKNVWQVEKLQEKYGARYRQAGKYLGNENYKNGGPIKIARPDEGIAVLLAFLTKGYTLILMCGCGEYEGCHRRVVCELVQAAVPEVQIVQPDALAVPNSIKCISIIQPYASWLANPQWFRDADIPEKDTEYRTWKPSYRGLLLFQASAKFAQDEMEDWFNRIPRLKHAVPTHKYDYPTKAIVGIATLTNVITRKRGESDIWHCSGQYGFVLENARPIEPIPYKGALGLFGVPVSLLEEQKIAV